MAIPAYCPNCQTVFPFRAIGLSGGAKVRIKGFGTNCPFCGGTAIVGDGEYEDIKGAVELVSGPDSTRAMIGALKGIAERLRAGEISKEQAVIEAEAISPNYGKALNLFATLGLPGIMLLLQIISMVWQHDSDKASSEIAEKMLNAVMEQTFTLKEIKGGIEAQSKQPPAMKAKEKPAALKNKKSRRSQVRKERRDRLIELRNSFGGARRH